MLHGIELLAEMDNKNGGLDIGGQKYEVEIISYDTSMAQSGEVSAVNRLIFEDKVKFILGDADPFAPAWLQVAEDNKVITIVLGIDYKACLNPNIHYNFNGNFANASIPSITGWLCKNKADMVKDIVVAFPDTQSGHFGAEQTSATWNAFGVTPTTIFYPSNATDLSSLGSKVNSLNPGAFMAVAGGASDALALKAVYGTGYRGQLFATSTAPGLSLSQTIPAEALEGFINGAWAVELDPAQTQAAQVFKDAWIAKYSKWEGVEAQSTSQYTCLKTGLQQAGSLDPDKVAVSISNGMKYESPTGNGQMISRPDVGNNRTVDSIATFYIKQIQGGKPVLVATISQDEALGYFRAIYPESN